MFLRSVSTHSHVGYTFHQCDGGHRTQLSSVSGQYLPLVTVPVELHSCMEVLNMEWKKKKTFFAPYSSLLQVAEGMKVVYESIRSTISDIRNYTMVQHIFHVCFI